VVIDRTWRDGELYARLAPDSRPRAHFTQNVGDLVSQVGLRHAPRSGEDVEAERHPLVRSFVRAFPSPLGFFEDTSIPRHEELAGLIGVFAADAELIERYNERLYEFLIQEGFSRQGSFPKAPAGDVS